MWAAPTSAARTDLILQRVFDVVMAFPLIIMALAVVAIFGTGVQNVIVAITIPLIPRCARVVRSSALAIREVPYVDAARALGFSHVRIILCHMVPNVMAPFLIMVTAFVGQAILAEASLSYLGLGVQEPVPAWGLMLQGGAEEYASTGAVDRHLPGRRHRVVGAGDQPVRRRPARYVGPEAPTQIGSVGSRGVTLQVWPLREIGTSRSPSCAALNLNSDCVGIYRKHARGDLDLRARRVLLDEVAS